MQKLLLAALLIAVASSGLIEASSTTLTQAMTEYTNGIVYTPAMLPEPCSGSLAMNVQPGGFGMVGSFYCTESKYTKRAYSVDVQITEDTVSRTVNVRIGTRRFFNMRVLTSPTYQSLAFGDGVNGMVFSNFIKFSKS